MSAPQRHSVLVSHGDYVVGVHLREQKTDETAPDLAWIGAVARIGAKQAAVAERGQLVVGIRGQILVVGKNPVAADGVQIIERGVESDGSGDVRRPGLELVRDQVP